MVVDNVQNSVCYVVLCKSTWS